MDIVEQRRVEYRPAAKLARRLYSIGWIGFTLAALVLPVTVIVSLQNEPAAFLAIMAVNTALFALGLLALATAYGLVMLRDIAMQTAALNRLGQKKTEIPA